jgi:hypothetical protein
VPVCERAGSRSGRRSVGRSVGFDRESDFGVISGRPVCAGFKRESESWVSKLLVSRDSEGERAASVLARASDF